MFIELILTLSDYCDFYPQSHYLNCGLLGFLGLLGFFYYFIRGFPVIRVFVVIMLLGQFEMLVLVSLVLGSIV